MVVTVQHQIGAMRREHLAKFRGRRSIGADGGCGGLSGG